MAWNNVRNEPKREWIEQGFGFLFLLMYIAWGFYCAHLSVVLYLFETCPRLSSDGVTCAYNYHATYWSDPGNAALWCVLMIAPWLLIPLWYITHDMGEFVCAILTGIGFDPRPNPRENTYEYKRSRGL